MPNRRHSSRRFTPSCSNSIANSCRCDMIDFSDHGTPASPQQAKMPIGCVHHVSEHPSTGIVNLTGCGPRDGHREAAWANDDAAVITLLISAQTRDVCVLEALCSAAVR